MTSAYQASAEIDWLHYSVDTLVPMFEKPRTHFADALRRLAAKGYVGAADEIRRGTAFLRLAAESTSKEDREALRGQLATLRQLAARAEKGDLAPAELRSELARVDGSYATAYLKHAEQAFQDDQRPRAGRALREAASRMRARLEWLGDEAGQAAGSLVDDLEHLGDELVRGSKKTGRKVTELFSRARRSLAPEPGKDQHG